MVAVLKTWGNVTLTWKKCPSNKVYLTPLGFQYWNVICQLITWKVSICYLLLSFFLWTWRKHQLAVKGSLEGFFLTTQMVPEIPLDFFRSTSAWSDGEGPHLAGLFFFFFLVLSGNLKGLGLKKLQIPEWSANEVPGHKSLHTLHLEDLFNWLRK